MSADNEVIVDATYLDRHLPDAIEAFFFTNQLEGSAAYADLVRRAFLTVHPDAHSVPVVQLDVRAPRGEGPFSVAPVAPPE